MKLSALKPDEIRRYFAARLPNMPTHSTGEIAMRCPFHEDSHPSFGVDLERGFWKCLAGCGGGKLIDFEKRISNCQDGEALENIAEILGESLLPMHSASTTEATYVYTDETGKPLFEVIKKRDPDGKKKFLQRHRDPASGDWIWTIKGVRRVLYNLPAVLTAREVILVEGEKCAETVNAELASLGSHNAIATTVAGGSGAWLADYAAYFIGKKVVIFPDNDEPGRKFAEQAAAAIVTVAYGVKVVALPGLAEKEDIADFLKAHTLRDVLKLVNAAPKWKPAESDHRMFVPASVFERLIPDKIDWMVESVIQRGANGFIVADPKGGKSFTVIDLCIALATGQPWLGFQVPRPTRVAYVSREDSSGLTGWRLRKVRRGRRVKLTAMDEMFYLNSREQTKTLMLDNAEELAELIGNLKELRSEIVFLDVFNKLHAASENDNTEMRAVLNQVERIQAETGAAVCLCHHWSKGNPQDSVTKRLRGASAIAGFAEFTIGITPDVEKRVRRMEFDLKVDASPEPVYYRIQDYDYAGNKVALYGHEAVLEVCSASDFKAPAQSGGRMMNE